MSMDSGNNGTSKLRGVETKDMNTIAGYAPSIKNVVGWLIVVVLIEIMKTMFISWNELKHNSYF